MNLTQTLTGPPGVPAMRITVPDAFADALAERIANRLSPASGWMNARQAAAHLGLSVAALHKLTSARGIPFSQDGPGGKLWFRAGDLDEWRYSLR
jgi:hypothetical protein